VPTMWTERLGAGLARAERMISNETERSLPPTLCFARPARACPRCTQSFDDGCEAQEWLGEDVELFEA